MRKLLFLVLFFVGLGLLKAQDTINFSRGMELDSIQVTANRTTQNITRTGRNVLTVLAGDIKKMPVHSIDEILRYLPGIEIQSRGGFGVQSDITLRGSTFNQVLILLDGVRLNDPLTGHFNGYIPVPLSEIDRIEVIKGTASSIYGADAVGGVVNIVTKKIPDNDKLDIDAEVRVGSNDYFGLDLGLFGQSKEWKFSAAVQSNHSNGAEYNNPNYDIVTGANQNYSTWFKTNILSGSLSRNIGDNWKLGLRSSFDERDFNAKYFYTNSSLDESVEKTTVFFNSLKLSGEKGRFKTNLDLVFRKSTDEFVFNPKFPSNQHTTWYSLFQLNQSFQKSNNHTFVYGTQIDTRRIESNDRGNHQNNHVGVYVQWLGSYFQNFNSSISLRADYDNNYQLEISPQINVSYIYKKFVFRGGVGKGIRAADFTERYISNNLAALPANRNVGNPDLVAELSWSYELGADYYIAKGIKIVTTGFYRKSGDLIDYVPTLGAQITNVPVVLGPNDTYFYSENLTSVNTIGLELELMYQKKFPSGNRLNTSFGYTGLESYNNDGIVSKYVSSHAKHLINGNILFSYKSLDMGISGLYKIREEAYSNTLGVDLKPQYFVTNVNASFRLMNNRLKLKGEVLNLFDEQYSDILGAQMPGRWLIASISISI